MFGSVCRQVDRVYWKAVNSWDCLPTCRSDGAGFFRLYFYHDSSLLSPFMALAQECLKDVFKTAFGVDLDIGLVVVLQTAGRPGTYNPHLHILLSSGGITPENKWHHISYIPYEILHRKWQFHLLRFIRTHLPSSPQVKSDIDEAWRQFPKGFVAHVQKGKVPPGGKGVAKYLAKYVVSPPISVRRIEDYNGKEVRYWYRDHKPGTIQRETIPALKFVGRMVQHILPKGFQRIRYYGFHGNVRYLTMLEKIQTMLPKKHPSDTGGYRVKPRKKFRELYMKTYGKDPFKCPDCGNIMELESIWHPQYGLIIDMMYCKNFEDTG